MGEQGGHRDTAGTKAAFPAFSSFPAGEIAAAPSLSFLSSALAARSLQPARFVFPLQSPSPTPLSVPRPCRSSPVPVSLSGYGTLHSCSPFPNVFLSCLSSAAFAFCKLCSSGPGTSPPCLGVSPHAPAHVSSLFFCVRASLLCDTSLQTTSYSGEVGT